MQQRFCFCGYKILVQYQRNKNKWQPTIIVSNRANSKKNHNCPKCGMPISINTLR